MAKIYARIGGMIMVPMKAPPGRPPLAKVSRVVKARVDDEISKGLDKFKKRSDVKDEADAIRRLLKSGLVAEGVIQTSASAASK